MVPIDLLREIGEDISGLQSQVTAQGRKILSTIQEGLGPMGEALASVDRRLDQFALNDKELSAKLDRILSVLASVSVKEAEARLERWVGSEYSNYANYGLTAARVRDLIEENSGFFVG